MKARKLKVEGDAVGQRIDNFLIRILKGVPKARIYRALRKGEVRVNGGRIKATYKLGLNDELRIPPIRVADVGDPVNPGSDLTAHLKSQVIIDNEQYLVINKPSGLPVHGGSGVSMGLIEALRAIYPEQKQLELAHRLDRETSGCLIIAKRRSALRALHDLWREHQVKKRYIALVQGHWPKSLHKVDSPLKRITLPHGERRVISDAEGKESITTSRTLKYYKDATLIEANPHTGRTHQIRVHAKLAGHPIAGDEKYGSERFNLQMRELGLKRLFLHSASIQFGSCEHLFGSSICALFDGQMIACLESLSD